MNQLFYGDNLDVLRRHVPDETADLIYLDPPFNSDQDSNVLLAERDGTEAAAQIKAFEDTGTGTSRRQLPTRKWSNGAALSPRQ
jgi:site-specific DNA-methyltransferase (adenine-specific)